MSTMFTSPVPSSIEHNNDDIKGLHLSTTQFIYSPFEDDGGDDGTSLINDIKDSSGSCFGTEQDSSPSTICSNLLLPGKPDENDGSTLKPLSFRLRPRPQHVGSDNDDDHDDTDDVEMFVMGCQIQVRHKCKEQQDIDENSVHQDQTTKHAKKMTIDNDHRRLNRSEDRLVCCSKPFRLVKRRRSHTRQHALIHDGTINDLELDLRKLYV